MRNIDLIPAERQMRSLLERLVKAEVTVLSARLDMDYKTPHPRIRSTSKFRHGRTATSEYGPVATRRRRTKDRL